MALVTVNSHRFDPYKNFKFRVKWDGKHVLGISKVSSRSPPNASRGETPGEKQKAPVSRE
jgi:hypothetical protein